MPSVADLYNLWLKAADLPAGKTVTVTIAAIKVETLHPRPGEERKALVLSFKDKNRRLILNAGNANRMAAIGGEDYTAWPGLVICLKRTKYTAQQDTIVIEPADGNGNGRNVTSR
jgi:hypothetical protein